MVSNPTRSKEVFLHSLLFVASGIGRGFALDKSVFHGVLPNIPNIERSKAAFNSRVEEGRDPVILQLKKKAKKKYFR